MLHTPETGKGDFLNPHAKSGFALALSLVLMAFLSLLIITLAALVGLQLRMQRAALSEVKAKQAARYAAFQALAQIQKSMGPDQRISANAMIFDDEISPEITFLENDNNYDWWSSPAKISREDAQRVDDPNISRNRHWVGVWDSRNAYAPKKIGRSQPRSDYAERTINSAVTWLVSGNTAAAGDGRREKHRHSPADNPEDGEYVKAVSRNSAGGDLKGHVYVPIVKMESGESGRASGMETRIAWWVSDESQKAPVNAVAPQELVELAKSAPYRMQSLPFYSGIHSISISDGRGYFSQKAFELDFDEESLDKIRGLDEIGDLDLLANRRDGNEAGASKSLFHDVAFNTKGILVNVRDGGLKKDLSLGLLRMDRGNEPEILGKDETVSPKYFPRPFGTAGYEYKTSAYPLLAQSMSKAPFSRRIPNADGRLLKGRGHIFGPQMYGREEDAFKNGSFEAASAVKIASEAFDDKYAWKDPGGPLWDQLRSYYNLRTEDSPNRGSIDARVQTDDRAGFKPIVKRFQVFYVPAFVDYGAGRYGLRLHIIPLLVLWNPFDAKISGDTYYAIRLSGSQFHQPGMFRFAIGYEDGTNHFQCLRDLRAEMIPSLSEKSVQTPNSYQGFFFPLSEKGTWNGSPAEELAKIQGTGSILDVDEFISKKTWFYSAPTKNGQKILPLGYGIIAPNEYGDTGNRENWHEIVAEGNLYPDFETAKKRAKNNGWSARAAAVPLYLNNLAVSINHGYFETSAAQTGLFKAQRNICAYRPLNSKIKFLGAQPSASGGTAKEPHSHSLTSDIHFMAYDPSGIDAGTAKIFAMQRIVNYLGNQLATDGSKNSNGPNGDIEGTGDKSMYERKKAMMLPLDEGGVLGGCFYLDVPHPEAEHAYKHGRSPHPVENDPELRNVLFDLNEISKYGIRDLYGTPPQSIGSYFIDMQDIVGLAPVDNRRPLASLPNQTPMHYAQMIYSPDYFASETSAASSVFRQERNPERYENLYLTVWIWNREGFKFRKFSAETESGEIGDTGLAPVPEAGPVLLHAEGKRFVTGQSRQSFPDPSIYFAPKQKDRSGEKNYHDGGMLKAFTDYASADRTALPESFREEYANVDGEESLGNTPEFRARYFINWLGINPRRHSQNRWKRYGGPGNDIADLAPQAVRGNFVDIKSGEFGYERLLHQALTTNGSPAPYGFVYSQPYAENKIGSQPFFNRRIFTGGNLQASVIGKDYNARNSGGSSEDVQMSAVFGGMPKTVQSITQVRGTFNDGLSDTGYNVTSPDGIHARTGLCEDAGTIIAPVFHALRKTEVVSNPAALASANLTFGSGVAYYDDLPDGYFDKSYGVESPEALQPSFAIGNSLCPARMSPNRAYQIMWLDGGRDGHDFNTAEFNGIKNGTRDKSFAEDKSVLYDMSWLLNNALWDEYFFSTLPYRIDERKSVPEGPVAYPQNPRIQYCVPEGETLTAGSLSPDDEEQFETNASKLWINGPFNVNSTSVDAWKTVLATYYRVPVRGYDGTENENYAGAPLLRWEAPYTAKAFTSDNTAADEDAAMQGYRSLSDEELEELAVSIVEHVKDRGPFYSMSHFVNRVVSDHSAEERYTDLFTDKKLLPRPAHGADRKNLESEYAGALDHKITHMQKGVLQAAIDSTSINRGFHTDDSLVISAANGRHLSEMASNSKYFDMYRDPRSTWENWRGVVGPQAAGAPAYLMQQDILARLGSFLTVRSDTFKIRAYGEVRNPVSGAVEGKAWCEMTVQRFPEYIDRDTPDQDPWKIHGREVEIGPQNALSHRGKFYDGHVVDELSAVNRELGRRFKIVSFRWLNEKEI